MLKVALYSKITSNDFSVAMQSVRIDLLTLLNAEPSYPTKLKKQMQRTLPLILYHLRVLEKKGFVKSTFQMLNKPYIMLPKTKRFKRGITVRVYEITPKGKDIVHIIETVLS